MIIKSSSKRTFQYGDELVAFVQWDASGSGQLHRDFTIRALGPHGEVAHGWRCLQCLSIMVAHRHNLKRGGRIFVEWVEQILTPALDLVTATCDLLRSGMGICPAGADSCPPADKIFSRQNDATGGRRWAAEWTR